MMSVPFLLGMLAGDPHWSHAPLFLSWLCLYLCSYPLLQYIKRGKNPSHWLKWTWIYGLPAVVLLVPALIVEPSLLWLGPVFALLFSVNIWHSRRKNERALLNDICAILSFSIGGAAAYVLGSGGWDKMAVAVSLFSFLYFMGSTFFIKTVFRERGNASWLAAARIFHVLLLVIPAAAGYLWMGIPYIFSAVRTFVFGGKQLRPWKVGSMEIIGVVQFLILSLILIKL